MATETETDTGAATPSEEVAQPKTPEELNARLEKARAIIQRNVLWSLGAGVLPLPLLDLVAVMGVQLKMLKELSDVYEIKFSKGIVNKLLYSLLSSIGGVGVGSLLGSLVKAVPVVGTTLGVISTPVLAGAFTHATGKVFLMHFEAGGTLLNLDPEGMRAHFKSEFERAKEVVVKLQTETKSARASKVA